jgi:membrane associated rhomboid family serine protease
MALWCDASGYEALVRIAGSMPKADARAAVGRALVESVSRDAEPDLPWWDQVLAVLGLPIIIGPQRPERPPLLTWTLAGSLVAIHLLVMGHLDAVINDWGFAPGRALHHGGLTLITSFFLHANWEHLLGNVYFLLIVGPATELALGARRMSLLIGAALLADGVCELVVMPGSRIPGIGASGGIAALMAYYTRIHPRAQVLIHFFFWTWYAMRRQWIRLEAWEAFALWVILQIVISICLLTGVTATNGIAHLSGAAIGLLAAMRWARQDQVRPTQ